MPENRAFGRFYDQSEERGILQLGILAADKRGVHVRRHFLHFGIERVGHNILLEVQERLFGNSLTRVLLDTRIDGRQQVVLCSGNLAVRLMFGFADRTEIEDPCQMEHIRQTAHIVVGRIVQMRRAQQPVRPDSQSVSRRHSAEVPRINNIFKRQIRHR